METTEPHNPLAIALAEVHKELRNPQKDASNPYFNSRYATLDALQDASRTLLAKHGLVVTQTFQLANAEPISLERVITKITDKYGNTREEEGFQVRPFLWLLKTTLVHTSGSTIESILPLVAASRGPQILGAEITYMRRYMRAAILDMTADEDTDGNEAQKEMERDKAGNVVGSVDEKGWGPNYVPKKKTVKAKKDDILDDAPAPIAPVPEYKGPIDEDEGKPDDIPGLEPLQPAPLEELTLLEQVQEHLKLDGFSEEQLMTLIRSFKLTREVMLSKVDDKTLSTIINKWETVHRRLKEDVQKAVDQKKLQESK